jgi:hypothetical protein
MGIVAERKIQEAIDEGLFDHLPGAGKPVKIYDDPLAAGSALFNEILRRNGVLPAWAQIEQAVASERQEADRVLARWTRRAERPMPRDLWVHRRNEARARYAEHLRTANDLVLKHSLTAGFVHRALVTIPLNERLDAFDRSFPIPDQSEDSA